MTVGTNNSPGAGTTAGPPMPVGPCARTGGPVDAVPPARPSEALRGVPPQGTARGAVLGGGAPGDALGFGIDPDCLPDGLVVADATGRVICFNRAAARMTATDPAQALGAPIERALPLEDLEGRRWWALTDPYGGLATRRGQPERNLLLPGGREVLVSASYVRTHPTGPLRRLVVTLRGTEARRRTERSHAELIATVAHELRSP